MLPPPFPFPDQWDQVDENDGLMYGLRWMSESTQGVDEQSASATAGAVGAAAAAAAAGNAAATASIISNMTISKKATLGQNEFLDLNGQGDIVLSEEWRDRLGRALKERNKRLDRGRKKATYMNIIETALDARFNKFVPKQT